MTTVVIGGGLGGALVARAIQLAGGDVIVAEADAEPGGIAMSIQRDGFLLEPAVGTLQLPHPALSPLLAGLDVAVRPAGAAARRRFVRHRGSTVEVGPGPAVLATSLVSARGKVRLAAEPLIGVGAEGESLQDFMVRRLGPEVGDLVAWLMAVGVHAGDPDELSASHAFPGLAALERSHGSLLRGGLARRRASRAAAPSTQVVEGGTARVAAAVAESLGEAWLNHWRVEHVEARPGGWRVHGPDQIEAERVVAAVPPGVLAEIYPPVTEHTLGWEWAPVAVVWLGLRSPRLPAGLGALMGPDESLLTLGFLFESSYAPERAPAGRELVKAVVGGAPRPHALDLSDADLVDRVTAELVRVLDADVEVDMSHVVRHRPGIPQYTAAHLARVDGLRRALPRGLSVAGWCYDGVGVGRLAAAAYGHAE
ncbi:MAG TPA: protoporphyrinogen oxidase [Acidimicrobiia bacterium]|nr:protoporphyrinogen oxidase [Acidimicrobiia bacterium]